MDKEERERLEKELFMQREKLRSEEAYERRKERERERRIERAKEQLSPKAAELERQARELRQTAREWELVKPGRVILEGQEELASETERVQKLIDNSKQSWEEQLNSGEDIREFHQPKFTTTKEEEKVLSNTLNELRMGYVRVAG